ncbi:MAG: hypothetical protein KJ706_08735 [Candidatus Omnitrophica bacterium]|nr:hypothetical protein [Candidatus Omnitrophota bacterium]
MVLAGFVVIGIIGLFLGIILGSLLGRVGGLQILAFILRIPITLVKSPKELKSKWKMWQELKDLRRVERLKRQKKIKELESHIGDHKKEIKKIRAQIRRVKWGF